MSGSYELFDHTADMGLRIRAPDAHQLLAPAAQALYAAIGELTATADAAPVRRRLELAGDSAAGLLRGYLAELLHLFERDKLIVVGVTDPELSDTSLSVDLALAPINVARSNMDREVKAITYHELSIAAAPSGVVATVIVDI